MALVVTGVNLFPYFVDRGYEGPNLFAYFVDVGVYHPAYFRFEINLRDPAVPFLQQSLIISMV
mgnify:CR=1 FL=1